MGVGIGRTLTAPGRRLRPRDITHSGGSSIASGMAYISGTKTVALPARLVSPSAPACNPITASTAMVTREDWPRRLNSPDSSADSATSA